MAGAVAAPDFQSRFVHLLERDEVAAVAAAAGPDADLASNDLYELRDMVEKYDCIDVRAVSSETEASSDASVTLRIALTAVATTSGGLKEETLLPRVWFTTFVRDGKTWRLKAARTHEARLADQLAAAPDDAARWELVRESDGELPFLASLVNFGMERTQALWPFAEALSRATGDPVIEANSYGRAAIVFRCEPERAVGYLETALERAAASGDADAIARAQFAAGVVRWMSGDVPSGLQAFQSCASMIEEVRDVRPSLQALHMLVHLELGRGNVSAAAAHAQRNAEASDRHGWIEGELNAANNMERIHAYLGNRGESAAASRQVLRLAAAIGRRQAIGGALYNLALTEEEGGNYEEATALLRRAGVKFYGAQGRVPEKLGDLLAHQGRYDEAETHYRDALKRARDAKDEMAEIVLLTRLSRLAAARGRFDEALTLAREAIADGAADPQIRQVSAAAPWLPRTAEGAALAGLGRTAEAAAAYEHALAVIETEKHIGAGEASPSFLNGRLEPFLGLLRLHVADGDAASALGVSERMKARVLRDLLDRGRVDLRSVLTDGERAKDEELNKRVVERNRAVLAAGDSVTKELRDALDQARAEQRAFEVQVQLAHPELRNTVPPPSPDDLRQWLDSGRLVPSRDALILDYVVGERETTLFAMTRKADGSTAVRTAVVPMTRKELVKAVERLVSRIERRDLGYSAAAEELYGKLIAPVEPLLAGRTRVSVVPHGALWQLPFAVLRGPDGRHLVERLDISYAPSLAYLARYGGTSHWLPENPRVLALGNPAAADSSLAGVRALTRATLGDLPEAETEAREVGRLYGSADVLLERAATEEAFKAAAEKHDILHFATHGISHAAQPLYSSLVLATRSEREDGLLEAREIVRMGLRAQLAVLSACETARGGIGEGEGVIGLSWAFLVAGCPRAIVTHWRADSAAAALAMVRMHQRIARTEGGGSVAGALRDAQLSLLRTPRYSHPYYWGGFVVVGASW